MTSAQFSTVNQSHMSISNEEKQVGICPDCLERELVKSLHMVSDKDMQMKKSAIYTCKNCGYQDERMIIW